ncbi:hypothetical protein JVT61DRAFT_5736 [Boletus reticuloceps]|uniref:Uncharacterized protein n=1 Tax=Boletus reticuloceps TaxID=495285 RepID=A0A8I2YZK1_9AGAM|nr:hypothetical protein JVT61DRAFT_5736 [Boletus reticuloceps]
MVGMLGLGNRHPPSAQIRRVDSPGSIANFKPVPSPAGQTQSVTTTDNTDSSGGGFHFFSIPHWTRRILPASASARKSLAGLPHADGRSASLPTTPSRRVLLEKELPPIPPPQVDANITRHEPSATLNDARVSVSVQQVTDTPLQPTFYLDVYHNTPMIPSPSQVSSVAFASLPNSSTENVLRKTKSTFSLQPKQPSPCLEQQRSRGVSLTQMFTTAKRASTSPCATDGVSPSTPLVRKSSFWSRKFSIPSPQHLTVPADSPSLPALKSTSPPRVDFTATPDSLARSHSNSSAARLSKRHSEHAHRSAARTNTPSLPHSPVAPDKTYVRPSTADPYVLASHHSPTRRPATADSTTPSRSRSRSFFTLSQQSTVTPPNNEPSSHNPLSRSKLGSTNSRPRSSTNPPLLHRLSINLFASSPTSAAKSGPSFLNGVTSSPSSQSPRPSLSQIPPDVLKPRASESSEAFVNRLVSLVSKADIAVVLASTGDPIYIDSLKLFIGRFGFHGEPLDVALRRLLMDVGLPRETQQIDRVIEAFANRYISCNPDLFTSRDHPYILAFSLIMLHTDAFNKSNRRKMSKAEYIRNTTLPGLIPEVLDCFYDNTVFAPFIFIEDPLDPEGSIEANVTRPSTSSGLSSPMMQGGNALLSRPKIDPYYLITNNLLDQLRVDVEGQISLENPFRWDGIGTSWNYDEILLAFAKGHVVRIGSTDVRSTTPFFGLNVGSSSLNGLGGAPETIPASETWTIKFTKVAVLNRKDDLLEGGKKTLNRKWRPYSVALTRSQLLLFRDLSWSSTLLSWNNPLKKPPIPSSSFKPDEIITLSDALAVLDRSYSKHLNTFRLTTRDGRHILFQTTEEKEMNEWISRINYASAFKTTGIRMRSLGMAGKVLELTGAAAATSHFHDLQLSNLVQPRVLTRDHHNPSEPTNESPGDGRLHDGYSADTYGSQSELADLSAPELEGASQLKETFDTVKAELAAARIGVGAVVEKAYLVGAEPPRLSSRSQTIRTRVEDLENRICAANTQIDSSMHIARNIAILAPFQKSTRDRLQDIIQTMSKKVQAMRLDVTKLICHRNILLNDLAVEERNFKHATSLALQAATETLQQRYREYNSQSSSSPQELPPKSSFHEETSTGSQSFDLSTCDTFRSALDFGPDWPSSGEAFAAPSFWVTPGYDNSTGCYPSPDKTSYLSLSTTNQSLPETFLHGNISTVPDFSEEQAEEWHKTRAAKRVSLVKLPSNLHMSAIASKSSCRSEDNSLLKEEPIAVRD